MIHTTQSMSIREYSLYAQTKKTALLKRWYNPLPVKWFYVDSFFVSLREIMGEDIDDELSNEVHRQLSYNKILVLDRIIKTMSVLMRNESERTMFAVYFKSEFSNPVGNMPYYIEKVKNITGIEVKSIKDLQRVQKETKRLLDKYLENYSPKADESPVKEIEFDDITLGVFSIMGMPYAPDMRLSEFGRLRKLANKKIQPKEKVE